MSYPNLIIEKGINRIVDKDGQIFFLYIPGTVISQPKGARVMVSVHGYGSRKSDKKSIEGVKRFAEIWSHLADEKRWIVLAPHFNYKIFNNNYQTLNLRGRRSDLHLNDLLNQTSTYLPDVRTEKIMLFGFSGGGQFVHRYMAFHPERVECAVAGAPGWYLWPDSDYPYPIGTAFHGFPKDLKVDMRGFCLSNLCVVVGERDSEQGAYRKSYGEYDLDSIQGSGRKARAKNFVEVIQRYASNHGDISGIKLKIVRHAAHKLNRHHIDSAEEFFCENVSP